MERSEMVTRFGEVARAINRLYGDAMRAEIEKAGFEGQDWFLMAVSHDFEPGTISAAKFAERWPYGGAATFEKGLDSLAERGLLDDAGNGEFRISAKGHRVTEPILNALNDQLTGHEPVPAADLARCVTLMERLVNAALHAPKPAHKPCITVNRHSDPGPDGPPLLRILQFVADMGSFRDDAHLASWRDHGVSGPAWEAYTLVWRGEARTPAELVEKLSHRGRSEADFEAVLAEAVRKQWVALGDDGYGVTAKGQVVRDEAEALTDEVYYAPWDVLSDAELTELDGLLVRLRDSLVAMTEEVAEHS